MKSVKELNGIADSASAAVRKTLYAAVDEQSFVEADRFIRSMSALGEATGEGVISGFASVGGVQVGAFAINGIHHSPYDER